MARSRYEYVNPGNWIFLTLLRWWAGISAFFFFRRYRVTGRENIPPDRPVIFTVNHQSAFLDPVLIGISCRRKPWYLTRAGVFTNALVRYILRAIHMLPVYRSRDRVNVREANENTFIACRNILTGGGSVLIFPEGNHGMLKHLRKPLRKGFARIAMDTLSHPGGPADIDIVPVGINYEHPTKFRTDVLIRYGPPLSARESLDIYRENAGEGLKHLTNRLEIAMDREMINIQPLDCYEDTEKKWMRSRILHADLEVRFNSDKQMLASADFQVKDNSSTGKMHPFLKVIGFPLFATGFALNIFLLLLVRKILRLTVQDPHFLQSVKFVLGMSLAPAYCVVVALALNSLTGYGFFFYLLLVPLSGIFAYDYYDLLFRRQEYVSTMKRIGRYLPSH